MHCWLVYTRFRIISCFTFFAYCFPIRTNDAVPFSFFHIGNMLVCCLVYCPTKMWMDMCSWFPKVISQPIYMTFDKLVTCHWFFIFSSFWGKLRNYKMIFVTRIWLFWFSDLLVQEPICNARRFKTNWDQLWKSFSPVLYLFIYILKFHHTVRDILVYQSFSTSHPYRSFQVERWDLCERISRFLFRCKIYWYFFHILVIVLYFYMLSCSTLIKNFGETCISQKVAVE